MPNNGEIERERERERLENRCGKNSDHKKMDRYSDFLNETHTVSTLIEDKLNIVGDALLFMFTRELA